MAQHRADAGIDRGQAAGMRERNAPGASHQRLQHLPRIRKGSARGCCKRHGQDGFRNVARQHNGRPFRAQLGACIRHAGIMRTHGERALSHTPAYHGIGRKEAPARIPDNQADYPRKHGRTSFDSPMRPV